MKSVLVVDDSRVSRKMLVNMLEVTGYTVAGEAIDGREGFEFYKKLHPDVVLMDITMPEMNGLDALRLIKEYDPDAKVIILSAAGQKQKKEEAEACGADAFVTKPYQNKDLLDAIENC